MADIDRAGGIGVLQDLVLAVAIGAQRRLGNAAGQSSTVHAGAELLDHFGVAHAAGIGDRAAEGLGFRGEQFVGPTVAQGAIGRALIAALAGLPVDAFIIVAGLLGVAGDAGGFGDVGGVRNFFVRLVAGIAGERGVRALGQFLHLLLTVGASRRGVRGVQIGAGDAGNQA